MNDDRTQNAAQAKDEVRWRVNNRIIGFSDGVFAIAITLLVLTIDVPANLTSQEVSSFLWGALPQVLIYGASFMVIGTSGCATTACSACAVPLTHGCSS
jgi:uncharacterized membrane protein